MNPRELRIVFFGTPAFAAHTLKVLLAEGYNVVAAVTAPDKPSGRGLKLTESEVKRVARAHQIPVLQPENLKSEVFLQHLKDLHAHLQIVVAFRMLPESVWSMPPMGTFNLHASLLPQYRGAAPINWAIINRENETGITTFLLDKEIDTGKILFRETIPIAPNETAGSLHDQLMEKGALLVLKTIDALASGSVVATNQAILAEPFGELRKAPKITKEHCRINWNKPVEHILAQIRGLSPLPGAFTIIDSEQQPVLLKIYEAEGELKSHALAPGKMITDGKNLLAFAANDGIVLVKLLKMEGKKQMTTPEFLRGYRR